MAARPQLMPQPRDIRVTDRWYTVPSSGIVLLRADEAARVLPAVESLQRGMLRYAGLALRSRIDRPSDPGETVVRITLEPGRVEHEQGYYLCVAPRGIRLRSRDAQGAYYGVQTLIQLLRQYGRQLPQLRIWDHPDFGRRGVLLDISRDKVPTMETLRELVEFLAAFKMNELQLYTEHTFAYAGHARVWAASSPMTPEQIQELDALCRAHYIDLVPNQNSFGHMGRWLKHEAYTALAETPGGSVFPWGRVSEPFSLAPAVPGSIELVEEMFDELLPNFGSRFVNVGCDETHDLGQGRSKELCERQGTARVHLDFLLKINERVRRHGRRMMFWGDIVMGHPELVGELPEDAIALEWGYEADHPFERDSARFAAAGVPFYVCPGTSTWCSIAGRTDNCIDNLTSAAESGLRHGAIGYLITGWGDAGHWDPLPVSYLGWCQGAALSWCVDANRRRNFGRTLGIQAFEDPTGQSGYAVYELGNAYKRIGRTRSNGSWLWWVLTRPLEEPALAEGIAEQHIESTRSLIARALGRVRKSASRRPDAALIREELLYVGRLLDHAVTRIQILRGEAVSMASLAADMEGILEDHERVWMARNRVGGWEDSRARLNRCLREYHEQV